MRVGAQVPSRLLFTEAGSGAEPFRNNLGLHVGDDPIRVHARREGLSRKVGRPIVWMNQTHSTRVAVLTLHYSVLPERLNALQLNNPQISNVDKSFRIFCVDQGYCINERMHRLFSLHNLFGSFEWGPIDCDSVIIDARSWSQAPAAAVMVADCVPVLIADSSAQVIAAVHAGRKGLQGNILSKTVAVMRELLADDAGELHATIGPSICGSCYEVPDGMRREMLITHPTASSYTRWGTPALDLPAGATYELRALGVEVRTVARCTMEDPLLHSYRRSALSGRQAGVIVPGSA